MRLFYDAENCKLKFLILSYGGFQIILFLNTLTH